MVRLPLIRMNLKSVLVDFGLALVLSVLFFGTARALTSLPGGAYTGFPIVYGHPYSCPPPVNPSGFPCVSYDPLLEGLNYAVWLAVAIGLVFGLDTLVIGRIFSKDRLARKEPLESRRDR